MRDQELDRILSRDGGIVPSSGFVARVMDAVRQEASTPRPIPFPWKRAVPGLAAWGVVLVTAVMASRSAVSAEVESFSYWARLLSAASTVLATADRLGIGWVALALLLSLGSVMLSMRLTGWRS